MNFGRLCFVLVFYEFWMTVLRGFFFYEFWTTVLRGVL